MFFLDKIVPSPAKKLKTTIGVHLPSTSTPKSTPQPHLSRISALTGSNNPSPIAGLFSNKISFCFLSKGDKIVLDSPRSNKSIGSNSTVTYDYTELTFNSTTVPFSPRPGLEVLILNDPRHFAVDTTQNAVDSFPSTSSNNTQRYYIKIT